MTENIDTVIVGTFGIDDIETPFAKKKNLMGGSGVFAAYAAAFFSKPGIIGVVGRDYPVEFRSVLVDKGIDLAGVSEFGKNFRWSGKYKFDMNDRDTLSTDLNNLIEMKAHVPDEYKDAEYIMLGNLDPDMQLEFIDKFKKPKLVIADTMNLWIDTNKKSLLKVLSRIDVLMVNDSEARELFKTPNLAAAAREALDFGMKAVIIKKGEHGALLFMKSKDNKEELLHFSAPGYPLEVIKGPTGCGDAFAGGMIGYLSKKDEVDEVNLRKAIIYGSVIASFNAEDFSLERLKTLTEHDIERRYLEFVKMREF